jgi:hypothetical protein
MSVSIVGKVAGLVSPTQITINLGTKQGVNLGDIVTVYKQVDVEDPDTKQKLGSMRFTKVKLAVELIAELYSLAQTFPVPSTDLTSILSRTTGAGPARQRMTLDPTGPGVTIAIGDPVYVERPEKTSDKGPPSKGATSGTDGKN